MKIVTQLFMILNLFLFLTAQEQVFFNKRIDYYNNYDKARNIIESDSGYVIGAFTLDEDPAFMYDAHLTFTGLTYEGELGLFKEYGYDSINMFLGQPGSLIRYSNDKYFSVGTKRIYLQNFVDDQAMLACYNLSFDTLWTRYYGENILPHDTAYMFEQFKKTSDNGFIMTGSRNAGSSSFYLWILKTDSIGNKQWENFIGSNDGYYYTGYSIVQTNDGGYAIGAVKFKIEATGGSMDPLIIKTDSLGNEEWRINPGNPDVDDNKVMLTLDADGNIIAGTDYGTQQSIDNRWAVSKIMKITPSGEIIWNYNYGEPGFDNFLTSIIVLNNGNIVSNGGVTKFDDGPDKISWILCVDSLGNELWHKEYTLLQGNYSQNRFYDILQTSDNGLISCGMVIPQIPDTGSVDIWVMKTDSLGCLEAGCDSIVGIENYFQAFKHKFEIYPNPASTNFTIDFKTENAQSISISIFNAFGNKFKEIIVPSGESTKKVDCSSWPAGVYVAVVQKNGYVTKFLINGR